MTDADRLAELLASEPYWTALAMKTQGSRFHRALGDALEAADATNRRLLYQTWPEAFWDFYGRGRRLEAGEAPPGYG
ncbi:hypothetical protein HNQ07_000705 [Deinococcus metalli]|uniref:Uncharacterized protein n=1 Tax=Deinococcus metalli TaxID=1141878 RepID=A0A7W8NN14_9DEIO|nr:hypothetical protein [Deinococcus metalli]MBB5375261.1 hypothetical protein [Deinococcus metalli]GHF30568.1 hypothetical protein GCM10017781_03360 [Deinococcus metalli]